MLQTTKLFDAAPMQHGEVVSGPGCFQPIVQIPSLHLTLGPAQGSQVLKHAVQFLSSSADAVCRLLTLSPRMKNV
jgi:hypothetical protein